ncbi:hypothetical protein [uncultured Agrococcus sp.]|uniref:hypothetical protein n=1 Tax=uncultured Agrococcus sp. TaxID=382258 RepID=UPI0025D5E2FB|nr:hypothetical protein [uncultured Agrococcus sp.]
MPTHERLYRRLLRRETRASRTVPAVIAATCVALLTAGGLVAGGLALFLPERLDTVAATVTDAVNDPVVSVTAGCVLLLLGVVGFLLAILPGRRTRHTLITDRAGVVIESYGLAESVATTVARSCGLQRRQVRASVHRRRLVTIMVRPVSGVAVDHDAVEEAARSTTQALGLRLRPRVLVQREGSVA